MFFGNLPITSSCIEIKEADRGAFLLMLEYIYGGDLDIDGLEISQLIQILRVAGRYDCWALQNYIVEKIVWKLTPENATETLLMAKKAQSANLVDSVLKYIKILPENSKKSLPIQTLKSEPALLIEMMKKVLSPQKLESL